MHYIEYSTSAGPGTLIEHGVWKLSGPTMPADGETAYSCGNTSQFTFEITPELYQEFIAIHGSERAV